MTNFQLLISKPLNIYLNLKLKLNLNRLSSVILLVCHIEPVDCHIEPCDDPAGMNYGKDIYKEYTTAQNQYGNYIGQGIQTQLIYHHLNASVLINPATNLNLSAGIVLRNKTTDSTDDRTKYIYFGLRSAIGNRYYDF